MKPIKKAIAITVLSSLFTLSTWAQVAPAPIADTTLPVAIELSVKLNSSDTVKPIKIALLRRADGKLGFDESNIADLAGHNFNIQDAKLAPFPIADAARRDAKSKTLVNGCLSETKLVALFPRDHEVTLQRVKRDLQAALDLCPRS